MENEATRDITQGIKSFLLRYKDFFRNRLPLELPSNSKMG
jgi:hypothetical protein